MARVRETPREAAGAYGMDFAVLPKAGNVPVAERATRTAAPTGRDLRGYLRFLEQHHPDQVYYVDREVDPKYEVTALLAKLERQGRYPVVIFRNVKGSRLPVVTNVHASFQRLAMAIGLPADATVPDFTREYSWREDHPLDPVLVARDEAPVKEVVLRGDEINVYDLPLLTYHEKDAGYYITCCFETMRDPDTRVRNAGIYRLMRQARDEFGIQISETAHGHYILKKHMARHEPTPVAIFIGHHPAVHLGCLSFTPYETDEFTFAGAMLGEPLRIVKCETSDLEVPADAEIVIEGEILPDLRRPEAPFGEYPGTYGPQRSNPVVKVKTITMRRDALYQSSFVGHPDNLLLSGVTRLSYIQKTVKIASPSVRAVYVPPSGRCRFICYIQMEKLIEGDPKNAAMAAFAADPFLKFVIVVDEDVDILNDSDVLHAIATRVRADVDTFMVTHARGSPLDPASYDPAGGSHIVTKVGIDATRKANYPDEISVPGTDQINPDDYLVPYGR
ncbi:MAG TPA: UbiD family decarboxylase [Chloroflexota bacterium]|nr:UbiD family decarboxylase [Chloroflexota bacterium]